MSNIKYTPGPWRVEARTNAHFSIIPTEGGGYQPEVAYAYSEANARLIAAAPDQHAEMLRYLPVLERAEADPELWGRLTEGLGIATLNGYRAAITKATGENQ